MIIAKARPSGEGALALGALSWAMLREIEGGKP